MDNYYNELKKLIKDAKNLNNNKSDILKILERFIEIGKQQKNIYATEELNTIKSYFDGDFIKGKKCLIENIEIWVEL